MIQTELELGAPHEVIENDILVLSQWIEAKNQAHEELMAPHYERIAELKSRLLQVCPHPQHKLERKHHYVEGGYLDRSQSTEWYECQVCGSCSEKKTTFGGYA